MSVIVAIKKNGRVYMGTDTLTSCGEQKKNFFAQGNRKITRFENGILLGGVGKMHNAQLLFAHSEIFTVPEDGNMTKRYVVENIIPKIFDLYREHDMGEKEEGEPRLLGGAYVLAYKDKIFLIDSDFDVTVLEHYVSVGSGADLTRAGLAELDAEDVSDSEMIENRLLELLRISASYVKSVGAPFYLIDTENLEYKLAQ